MTLNLSFPVFAAENDTDTAVVEVNDETGIAPQNTVGWCAEVKGINSNYKEVASAPNGFNCTVRLTMTVPADCRIDVAMYRNGSKVWEETDAFNGSREFWCGSDITSIKVRVVPRLGAGIVPLTYTCGVDVFGTR